MCVKQPQAGNQSKPELLLLRQASQSTLSFDQPLRTQFTQVVLVGDKLVDWHESFRLYLATRNAGISLAPDASPLVTVANFNITPSGLEGKGSAWGVLWTGRSHSGIMLQTFMVRGPVRLVVLLSALRHHN